MAAYPPADKETQNVSVAKRIFQSGHREWASQGPAVFVRTDLTISTPEPTQRRKLKARDPRDTYSPSDLPEPQKSKQKTVIPRCGHIFGSN